MRAITLLFLLLFLTIQPLFGSVTAVIQSEQSEIDLKTALVVTITLTYPEEYSYSIEQIEQNILRGHNTTQPFKIIDRKVESSKLEDGVVVDEVELTLEAWDPGNHYLALRGPLIFDQSGKRVQILSNIVPITVQAPKIGEESSSLPFNLMPIEERPLIEISPDNEKSLLDSKEEREKVADENIKELENRKFPLKLFSAVLLFSAASFLAYKLFSRYLRSKIREENERQDPKEKALSSLYQLEKESLPEKGMVEQFYITLSRIVRFYIEDQYRIDAPESTTEEFLEEVKEHPNFKIETQELLKNFLESSDLVKFAQISSSTRECDHALSAAKKFIEER